MADEGGVWRTISGRRVFIRDGQSLSEAMRESGKFGEKENRIKAPELKSAWTERHDQGKALREKYPEADFESAVKDAVKNNPDIIADYMNDLEEWGPKTCFIRGQFFKAGFYGDEPEYVQAIRYGKVPESGQSMNWATHEYEQGVSVVKIVRQGDSFSDDSIYSTTQGEIQGIPKYEVRGWFLGRTGSDGEPLLVDAETIREIKEDS